MVGPRTTTEMHVVRVWFFGRFPGAGIEAYMAVLVSELVFMLWLRRGARIEERL